MNRVTKFNAASSTTATTIGGHTLAIPGPHESAALTDGCPQCAVYGIQPVSVLDVVKGNRAIRRIATYQCTHCQTRWLCHWEPPIGPDRVTTWERLEVA